MDRDAIERESLGLAARDCAGEYTIDHIACLRVLAAAGLVEHVETPDGMGRTYRITDAGRERLRALTPSR